MIWQAMMSSSPWGCLVWDFLRAAGSRTYGPPFGRFRPREVRPGVARAQAAVASAGAEAAAVVVAAVVEGAAHEHCADRRTDTSPAGIGCSAAWDGGPSRAQRRGKGVGHRRSRNEVSPLGSWHRLASGN